MEPDLGKIQQVLESAVTYLQKGWCQGAMRKLGHRKTDQGAVQTYTKAVCSIGAITDAVISAGLESQVEAERFRSPYVSAVVDYIYEAAGRPNSRPSFTFGDFSNVTVQRAQGIATWNDAKERKLDEVLEAFQIAIKNVIKDQEKV